MGKILAGDSESYQYLIESIERFPSQPDFAQLFVFLIFISSIIADLYSRMREAGFQTGQMREGKGGAWEDYTNGIATAWTGVKA